MHQKMTLVYDDDVDPSYDIQSTLEFVEEKDTGADVNENVAEE